MLGLKSLRDTAPSRTAALDKLGRLQKLAEQLSRDVHRLAWELRPAELDVMGLVTAFLRLIAWRHGNKEIAAQLKISVKTVEAHKAKVMEKLELKSRVDIVRYALHRGWREDS